MHNSCIKKNTNIFQQLTLPVSEARSQIGLFTPILETEDPPPYPLQIEAIPYQKRVTGDFCCKLVHYESSLSIPGQFTYPEASEILKITRYWDWELDRDRIPKCAEKLWGLLNYI